MTALTQQLNAVSADNKRLKNIVASQTTKDTALLQSHAIKVLSTTRNSWTDVKLDPGKIEITQLKVPADGEYLLLANLRVEGAQSSDQDFELQVIRVNDNDALIDQATVYQKATTSVSVGELATWTFVTLKKDQLIRLRYKMVVTTVPSTEPFAYSHARLALVKLN